LDATCLRNFATFSFKNFKSPGLLAAPAVCPQSEENADAGAQSLW
jgi:hypothetical protein